MSQFNIENIIYFTFRIFPILLPMYFVISAIFSLDAKGFIYLAGLLIACILNIFIESKINVFDIDDVKNKSLKCNIISLGYKTPLSQTIYAYTLFFILYIVGVYSSSSTSIKYSVGISGSQHLWRRNWPTILLLGIVLLVDMVWNIANKCSSFLGTFFSFFIGSSVGVLWAYVVTTKFKVDLRAFNGLSNETICKRTTDNEFKCFDASPNSLIQE